MKSTEQRVETAAHQWRVCIDSHVARQGLRGLDDDRNKLSNSS